MIYGNAFLCLREVFYGKSPILEKAEEQIGLIRDKVNGTYMVDIDGSSEVVAFNRLMEKQFGMDVFALHIENFDMKNAWTCPIARRFDIIKDKKFRTKLKVDKKSFKYIPDNGLCIVVSITTGILLDKDITNEEVLAILLHEIGHNFADCIDRKIYLFDSVPLDAYLDYWVIHIIIKAIIGSGLIAAAIATGGTGGIVIGVIGGKLAKDSITDAIDITNLATTNSNEYVKKQSEKTEKSKPSALKALGKTITGVYSDVKDTLRKILNTITLGAYNWLFVPSAYIASEQNKATHNEPLPKSNEVMADKFATIWGYGEPLITGLAKITNKPTTAYYIIDHIPVVVVLANVASMPGRIINNYVDEHPNLIQRLDNQIATLEYEVAKKDMHLNLRQDAKVDIAHLNAIR